MPKLQREKLIDYSVDDQIKLMQAQHDVEIDTIWREKFKKLDTRNIVSIILSVGAMIALIGSLFFNNPEVPKVAQAVIFGVLGYLAGRSSR